MVTPNLLEHHFVLVWTCVFLYTWLREMVCKMVASFCFVICKLPGVHLTWEGGRGGVPPPFVTNLCTVDILFSPLSSWLSVIIVLFVFEWCSSILPREEALGLCRLESEAQCIEEIS